MLNFEHYDENVNDLSADQDFLKKAKKGKQTMLSGIGFDGCNF